jgi:hypothetical protein
MDTAQVRRLRPVLTGFVPGFPGRYRGGCRGVRRPITLRRADIGRYFASVFLSDMPYIIDFIGGRTRTRTLDPLIKCQTTTRFVSLQVSSGTADLQLVLKKQVGVGRQTRRPAALDRARPAAERAVADEPCGRCRQHCRTLSARPGVAGYAPMSVDTFINSEMDLLKNWWLMRVLFTWNFTLISSRVLHGGRRREFTAGRIKTFSAVIYGLGAYLYQDLFAHGSPGQRAAAVEKGYRVALDGPSIAKAAEIGLSYVMNL